MAGLGELSLVVSDTVSRVAEMASGIDVVIETARVREAEARAEAEGLLDQVSSEW